VVGADALADVTGDELDVPAVLAATQGSGSCRAACGRPGDRRALSSGTRKQSLARTNLRRTARNGWPNRSPVCEVADARSKLVGLLFVRLVRAPAGQLTAASAHHGRNEASSSVGIGKEPEKGRPAASLSLA
jgi:hypothetical protein